MRNNDEDFDLLLDECEELDTPKKPKKKPSKKAVKEPVDTDMETAACLNRIVQGLRTNNLNSEFISEHRDDFDYVAKMLGTNEAQTAITGVVMEEFGGRCAHADVDDLTRALGCSNIEFISYKKDLDILERKRIVRIVRHRRSGDNYTYEMNRAALEAIEQNVVYTPENVAGLSPEDMFTKMRLIFNDYFDEALSAERLAECLSELVFLNPSCKFSQCLHDSGIMNMEPENMTIFMYMSHRYGCGGLIDSEVDRAMMLLPDKTDANMFARHLKQGRNRLFKEGLITFGAEEGFIDTDTLCLSEDVRSTFFTELNVDVEGVKENPDVKDHTLIPAKKLYYNKREGDQITRLASILKEENLKGVQNRLKELGMRSGICILMHGAAGTGKTESCLQLARMTGRDIFIVDVAKLRSKWVGDSERSVRGVFKYYRQLCKKKEIAPILLFNEADSIFGVRKKVAEDSVDKMNNTINNIILTEMETLDGILCATTNLAETNLDSAFERRFLFKIKFDVPEEEPRTQIWKSMMPELSDEDALSLAKNYDFSGGQIENIARKSTIEYILEGNRPSYNDIVKFCSEETLSSKKERARIGY